MKTLKATIDANKDPSKSIDRNFKTKTELDIARHKLKIKLIRKKKKILEFLL